VATYFNQLDRRFREEIINPFQTKMYKFAANLTARSIIGQSHENVACAAASSRH
jgi:hypothetical protein